MKNTLISVVMPAYNAEKYLDESIQSILNQTFKDFEFIIVNDGSSDNTKKIIEKFKKKDKRIILLNNPKNMGLQKSLNIGLEAAKGKYIARMDADDISLPRRFEIQASYLDRNSEIFLIGGSAILIDENSKKMGALLKGSNFRRIRKKLLKSNPIIHPSIMFRNTKEFFYRDKFLCSEDYDLYLRMINKSKKLQNIEPFLIKYRISKNSFVSTMPHQLFYFNKAKEFYLQREKHGKDNYDNLKSPLEKQEQIPFDKLNLQIKIFAELQDNQSRNVRGDIGLYYKKYGMNKQMIFYYILSFLPYNLIKFLGNLI